MPTRVVFVTIAFIACATLAMQAQRPTALPRDLSGTWTNATATPLERSDEHAGRSHLTEAEAEEFERTWLEKFRKGFPPEELMAPDLDYTYMDRMKVVADRRTSLIVDPPDGRIPPLLPAARARAAARAKESADSAQSMGLAERCLLETSFGSSSSSPPLVPNPFGGNFQRIVQTATHVAIHSELVHDTRIIRIGGAHPAARVRLWLGDSIGRWEGDTLVVDTTNLSERTHFRSSGPRLHVVERFTRVSPTLIRYRFTVEDPETWDRPWSAEIPLNATTERMHEYACHEGNYSMTNLLQGARIAERKTAP